MANFARSPRGSKRNDARKQSGPSRPKRSSATSTAGRKKLTLGESPKPSRAAKSEGRPAARRTSSRKPVARKRTTRSAGERTAVNAGAAPPSTMRLNRFIASSGVTSRRKADELITSGAVRVNGKTVLELGTTIHPHQDHVLVDGKTISIPQKHIYLILNKPKDTITTAKDEKGRKTVFDLVNTHDRVFTVGRLDRNTTGVLLLTNDGELTNRLTHPSYQISREYQVTLDKALATQDAKKIAEGGLNIGDGDITGPAHVAVAKQDARDIVLTITEGKNREVRRIFEHLGYDVRKLDRVAFAGITHRGMVRGEVRPLTRQEVRNLQRLVGLDTEY